MVAVSSFLVVLADSPKIIGPLLSSWMTTYAVPILMMSFFVVLSVAAGVGDLFSNAMNQEQGNTKMLNIKYPSSAEALSPQGFNELRTKDTNIILQR
jgi:hypothetical protein